MKEDLLQRLRREYNDLEKMKLSTMIYNSLGSIDEKDTNKIYVYCGATSINGDSISVVKRDSKEATNMLYWDIEQPRMVNIPLVDSIEFEKQNNIVYGEHHKIMLDFFTEAITTSQEEAVKKILKKYKK